MQRLSGPCYVGKSSRATTLLRWGAMEASLALSEVQLQGGNLNHLCTEPGSNSDNIHGGVKCLLY